MDRLARDLDRSDHPGMDPWTRWTTALADPAATLTVTVAGRFAGRDWDMGRRTLDDHMLHAIVAGGQDGHAGGAPVRTGPGDLLWIPPGMPQDLCRAATVRGLRKVYLRFQLARDGRPVPPPADEPLVRALPGAAALLGEAVDEQRDPRPHGPERIRAVLVLLFTAWHRAAARAGGLPEARRARLLALLDEDPARRWAPRALAAELGLSPVHLSRQVRTSFGVPLRRLLVEHRVRAAAADLAEGFTVGAAAARHGWSDPLLFSRQFRQVFGVAPRTWARER
ncbi:MAG: hypothetical protein RLZZ127_149 [Planctomycetota bacterium]|jgi:AraC-like DNA-binding protein